MWKKILVVGLSSSLLVGPTLTSASGLSNNSTSINKESHQLNVEGKDYTFSTYETTDLKMVKVLDENGKEKHRISLNLKTDELVVDGEAVSEKDKTELKELSNFAIDTTKPKQISKGDISPRAIEYPSNPGSSWSHVSSFTRSFSPWTTAPVILGTLLIYIDTSSPTVKNKAAVLHVITAAVAAAAASTITFKVRVYKRWWERPYPYADKYEYRVIVNTYNSAGRFLKGIDFICY
jgi:hypothetical protein